MMNCKNCSKNFEGSEAEQRLRDKIAPEINGETVKLPEPNLCLDCREQRRLAFRNERKLYKRKCRCCDKEILSVFSPDKNLNALCNDCFWSDDEDGTKYYLDYNPEEPFFEQFEKLFNKGKLLGLFAQNIENSDYVNQEMDDKNSYMCVGGHYNQDCYYCTYSLYGENNVDSYFVWRSNNLYESVNCQKCSNSQYLNRCDNCSNCFLCEDCIGCSDCFGSCNLHRKQYVFFNEQLTKEEYLKRVEEAIKDSKSKEECRSNFEKHRLNFPKKFAGNRNVENCFGDNLANCKNLYNCFWSENSQDSYNAFISGEIKDTLDTTSLGFAELCYESASSAQINRVYFCSHTTTSSDLLYSYACFNSNNLFGCVGLIRKEYCILNKQYTKEEYFKKVKEIIDNMKQNGEWGNFFPLSISPFGYNETVAMERYPLSQASAEKIGAKWHQSHDETSYIGQFYTPEAIKEYDPLENSQAQNKIDECLSGVLKCEKSGKPYKLVPQELKYYIERNIEIPKRHPDQRHLDRLNRLNPMALYHRQCINDNCQNEFETTYSPDRPEKIYCEECYQKNVL